MILLQQAVSEPIVVGGAIAGTGLFFIWLAKTVLEIRDSVRDLVIEVFGNPRAQKPQGMKDKLDTLVSEFAEHKRDESDYKAGISRLLSELKR